ncbi:MAG: OmpA family protein [Methylococcales bacterium]
MKALNPILLSTALALACYISPTQAEQVQIYNTPPSAEEMARVLFGKEATEDSTIKMRSISFGKKTSKGEAHESSTSTNVKKSEMASIGLPIKFAYNSDEILDESVPFLEEVGKMLNLEEYSNKRLVIEGHTDSVGSDSYNKALSQRRANSVKQYLSKNFDISASRLRAQGMGESKPLPGYSPDDEANRRVQFYSAN